MTSAGQKRTGDEIENVAPENNNVPKKIKTSSSTNASASSSAIVNINFANFTPLSDRGGQHRTNTSVLSAVDNLRSASPLTINTASPVADSADSSHSPQTPPQPANIDYPAVDTALTELHNAFPIYNLPQYAAALFDRGIATVDDVRTTSDGTLEEVGMSSLVMELFRERARVLSLIAEGHGVSCPRY